MRISKHTQSTCRKKGGEEKHRNIFKIKIKGNDRGRREKNVKRQRISIIKCRFLKSRNVRKYNYSEKLNDYKYIYQNGIFSTCALLQNKKRIGKLGSG